VVTSNALSNAAKIEQRERGFTEGMYLMADGMSPEGREWESMPHLMEQLVAHDPSHQKRAILDPRFSTPETLFPLDIKTKELQSCSKFSITEVKFRTRET